MLESRHGMGGCPGHLRDGCSGMIPSNAGNNHLGLGHPFKRVSSLFQKGWAAPTPLPEHAAHRKGARGGHQIVPPSSRYPKAPHHSGALDASSCGPSPTTQ